jgi:hypothetical protein
MTRHRLPALLGAALLAGAIVGVAWHALNVEVEAPVQAAVRPAATPLPPVHAEPRARAEAIVASSAGAAAAASGAMAPANQALWDLCGIGRMPVPRGRDPAELPPALGEWPLAEASTRLLTVLEHGTPRQRAAARLVAHAGAQGDVARPLSQLALQLAQHGRDAGDAVVMAWALALCEHGDGCAGQVIEDWIALQPENLAPWLALASAEPTSTRALAGMRQARHFRLGYGALSGTVRTALTAAEAGYVRASLLRRALAIEGTLALPPLMPVTRWCPARPGVDASDCDHLAQVLTTGSDTLLGYFVGTRVAERAGWPAARLEGLRATRKRLEAGATRMAAGLIDPSMQPWSCTSAAAVDDFVRVLGDVGELEAALRVPPGAGGR